MKRTRNILKWGARAGENDTIIRSPSTKVGFATNVGRVRSVDEDSLLATEIQTAFLSQPRTRLLLMVADGMGGHRRGDVASKIVVQTVARTLLPMLTSEEEVSRAEYCTALLDAVVGANQAVFDRAQSSPEYEGMGTTLALAVVDGRNLYVSNVGDSRVYLVNKREICQVTRDHSLVQEMVDRGEITAEEARHHPRKNVITMVLGVYGEVTPDVGCLTVEPGDRVLLCCDGLVNHVEDGDIHRVVVETGDPQRACEILVALANKDGGKDNISVVLAPIPKEPRKEDK
ncbi:MAG TPA: Stp1/IreP family PP2C-type Ser/Thr phosphatase [Thermoplasmata archaeon]|nr:Stp1/IreP family PP2C-type Ser/Thr phosphatase [Thermoplasmata archaeon]